MKKIVCSFAFILLSLTGRSQVCTVIISHVINGNQVQYYGNSPDNPSGWSWFFNGGNPLTSSIQNPMVTYAASGQYISALSVYGGPNSCSSSISNATDTVVIVSTSVQNEVPGKFSMNFISSPAPQFEILNDKTQNVKIELWDLNGKKIETVFEGTLNEGKNSLFMKTYNVPSAIYIFKLTKEDGTLSQRFFLE